MILVAFSSAEDALSNDVKKICNFKLARYWKFAVPLFLVHPVYMHPPGPLCRGLWGSVDTTGPCFGTCVARPAWGPPSLGRGQIASAYPSRRCRMTACGTGSGCQTYTPHPRTGCKRINQWMNYCVLRPRIKNSKGQGHFLKGHFKKRARGVDLLGIQGHSKRAPIVTTTL